MNLTIDPWIPALTGKGNRDLFSLEQIFAQAHTLRDLAVKPHERVAVMRLLLCVAQAALDGPADEGEWEQCEGLIQPRALDYLEKWRSAFDLFGSESRFLQFPNLKPGKESDEGNLATKLDLTLASGHNPTLFDNSAGGERSVAPARAALNLLTFQCFSPSGRIGVARWDGQDTPGKGSSNHAPCTPSSMLHTLVLGETLLEIIHRNLLTREIVTDHIGPDRWGRPVWEMLPAKPQDKAAIENATRTYLGRLVPLSRAVRLNENASIILANGLYYPPFPEFREPTASVIKRKDEWALLAGALERSLWRQLAAISVRRRTASDLSGGPLALTHPLAGDTTLWVGALVTNNKNTAKIEDTVESAYSLPAGMFSEVGRAAYEKGVGFAEEHEAALTQSLKVYASALKVASPDAGARRRFWTMVEQHLSHLFELVRNPDLVIDLAGCAWGRAVTSAALDAYEQSCPRQTPRQIQAYALGLRRLRRTHNNRTSVIAAYE